MTLTRIDTHGGRSLETGATLDVITGRIGSEVQRTVEVALAVLLRYPEGIVTRIYVTAIRSG